MSGNLGYTKKFNEMLNSLPYEKLQDEDLRHIREISPQYLFTFQDLRGIFDIAIDFKMWVEGDLIALCPPPASTNNIKAQKKKIIAGLELAWSNLKITKKSYENFNKAKELRPDKISNISFIPSKKDEKTKVLGKCPVASEKTLCCNLQTLDVVDNCGFECAYCSIQSFFPNNTILYEDKLSKKLERLDIDPAQTYHIGTGQSSDSMMWGNKADMLTELTLFAKRHPNVILEYKTKSKNITYLLNNDIPKNVICTWSLNPDVIIQNEEHHTASFDERISAARKLADKGILVGFHLHPIIYYDNFEPDYQDLVQKIMTTFKPSEIAMISMGTLTFTKPVLKEIRKKEIYSKILQMPMVQASGKLSYPEEIKNQMFKVVYDSFKQWHESVFFYLCMEEKKYWDMAFGFSYADNNEFEIEMKKSYFSKINAI